VGLRVWVAAAEVGANWMLALSGLLGLANAGYLVLIALVKVKGRDLSTGDKSLSNGGWFED
jgi:hypothetical protein